MLTEQARTNNGRNTCEWSMGWSQHARATRKSIQLLHSHGRGCRVKRDYQVAGGPHDGCRLRVPGAEQPTLWLPLLRVAEVHAVYAFERTQTYPLEYRLADEVYTLHSEQMSATVDPTKTNS